MRSRVDRLQGEIEVDRVFTAEDRDAVRPRRIDRKRDESVVAGLRERWKTPRHLEIDVEGEKIENGSDESRIATAQARARPPLRREAQNGGWMERRVLEQRAREFSAAIKPMEEKFTASNRLATELGLLEIRARARWCRARARQ